MDMWLAEVPCGSSRPLSQVVCWSRMQDEAGQELRAIIARKELERRAGRGLFLWGVGNAPGRAPSVLARAGFDVDVIFSVMKSRPKASDLNPSSVIVWRRYIDADAVERPLPDHVLVTSRGNTVSGLKRVHYALMCRSDAALELGDLGPFDPSAYRNFSGTGAPIGASQVTVLLRRVMNEGSASDYTMNMRAKLAESYWVKLTDPVRLCASKRLEMESWLARVHTLTACDWHNIAAGLRTGDPLAPPELETQARLF